MIEKIGLNKFSFGTALRNKKEEGQEVKTEQIGNDTEVASKEAADALKALAFKGSVKINAPGDESGIRVNDFIDCADDMEISEKFAGTAKFIRKENGLEIKNAKDETVFRAEFEDANDLPKITYKAGKFNPEITIHDESLGGGRIHMLAGSEIKGEKFTFTMPGEYTNFKEGKDVSFTGHTVVTTLNKENRTKEAVDKYFNSGLAQKATKGDYADFMKDNDPTIAIPAGGFGSRFMNFSEEDGENKPSSKLPTDDSYRIMATSLNMGAMAGLVGGEDDKLDYISQADDKDKLKLGDNVHGTKKYKTDGGAIYAGMKDGIIDNDKDLIVLNADIITNADVTRAYKALKDLPDAALVIPYYPVDETRAGSFGLMGLETDENGNSQIKEFVEKPNTPEKWDLANRTARREDGMYYGNPGIYVMSKEGASVLKELGDKDETKTGLGADVMKEIVRKCNNGELKTADGKPMKAYTVPLERKGGTPAFWDDIGSAEAYLKTIKKVASETQNKGTGEDNQFYGIPEFVLNDFNKNVDLDSSVVYMSDKARDIKDAFSEKYGATITGNILVAN